MKRHFVIFLLLISTGLLQAQSLSQAKILYSKGDYKKALPIFEQGLKTNAKDPSLNLWYGVCLLETGKLKESLPYLEWAEKKRLPEADRYMAKYYLQTLAPDSALTYIETYLENPKVSEGNKKKGQELKTAITSCVEQLQRVEDVCFIDSVILPKKDLFKSVKLSMEAGSIKPVNSTFNESPATAGHAYFPERNDRAYYASKFPDKGLDLVARHRILNDWGNMEPLSDVINSEANECNPYFLSDGTTLYFASNGHGSIGGYDLFVSRLNRTTNTYLLPDRLNMPFNSTANDYFLILDEFANRGYLATDRNQPEGFVILYTFIPNHSNVLLQGKSFKELQDFAQIRSIKATQVGKNLDSLLQKTMVPVLTVKEEASDLVFTINDSLSYRQESDFKSVEAKTQFGVYRSLFQKYANCKKSLEDKRAQYLEASPENQKTLGTEILKLEGDVLKASRELPKLEKSIRNLEISALSK